MFVVELQDKSEPATADTTVTQTDTVQDDTAQPTETPMAPPDTESTQKSVVLAEPTTNVAAQVGFLCGLSSCIA